MRYHLVSMSKRKYLTPISVRLDLASQIEIQVISSPKDSLSLEEASGDQFGAITAEV